MTISRRHFIASLGALSLSATAPAILAQGLGDYPNRPIKIIVPLAAGGGSDLTARQIAKLLTERMGSPVIVENKPGASGSIGTNYALRSPADGYTLIMLSSSYTSNAALRELPYDSIQDIEPISLVNYSPLKQRASKTTARLLFFLF
ncbi:Bug family tripartite tricarboxylate transporter substrate binding protein [Orrella sp. 11846]|uniref:Bug family tripartite tricarboxylate transporter substrate binding protein n=1 Tax=Orrella sp. 11846 TaxID=3409913 RepID=UPI003B5B35FA